MISPKELFHKNPKVVVAFAGVAFVSLVLVFVYFAHLPKNQVPNVTPPIEQTNPLQITEISPSNGILYSLGQSEPVFIYTNVEINPKSVIATSSPDLFFRVKVRSDDPKRVIIEPSTPWVNINYKLLIRQGVTSINGKYLLDHDLILNLEIKDQPNSGGGELN